METQNAVPETVRQQGEAADEIYRKAYPEQFPEKGKKPGAEKGKEPPATPPDTPEHPATTDNAQPDPAPGKKEDDLDWKQRYETLSGKYNAEVPQLHQTVAAQQNQFREILAEMERLKQAASKAPEPPKKEEAPPPESERVKSFKEEYPDIYESVGAMIESAAAKMRSATPASQPPAGRTPSPESPATPPPKANPRASFYYFLGRDVPDWEKINGDSEFMGFLQGQRDPLNPTQSKLDSIQAAYEAMDTTTVIGYFRDFKNSKTPAPPAQSSTPKPEDQDPNAKFLAPPKGGGGRAPASNPPISGNE